MCVCVCVSFPFGFEGGMWGLIVLIIVFLFTLKAGWLTGWMAGEQIDNFWCMFLLMKKCMSSNILYSWKDFFASGIQIQTAV